MDEGWIQSVQNPLVKRVAALRRHPGRADEILIDGSRELSRALEGGVRIRRVFDCPERWRGETAEQLRKAAREAGAEVVRVGEAVLGRIAYGERSEGVVALGDRPRHGLEGVALSRAALVAVVEGVEKPGNLGAVLRSADGAGVDAVVAVEPRCDVYGPNVIRSSLGTLFTMALAEATFAETAGWIAAQGMRLVAARPDGEQLYTEVDMRGPTAVLLGSEAGGLTGRWSALRPIGARIDMRGAADSLNVSVCAALFFYEAVRQRADGGSR